MRTQPLIERHGRARVKEALRLSCARLRAGTLSEEGKERSRDSLAVRIVEDAEATLRASSRTGPRRVLNATGILLHTNLGRSPLAPSARQAILEAAGFCDLEYRIESGERGKRGEHVQPLINELFCANNKAFDSLAVTNAAGALLLALDTEANGKKAAVSRGELVAIGGDFRIPSIMKKSGAVLMETGTTNKTSLEDYREALEGGASCLLKVHPSNYRIIGFTEDVSLKKLVPLAREFKVPLIFDAGAGLPLRAGARVLEILHGVPRPEEALLAGADFVCFSADKVLGGPQAGILLGRAASIEKARKNPLARALRPDKLVLSALAATLDLHLSGKTQEIPFYTMLLADLETIKRRALELSDRLSSFGLKTAAVETQALAGGGSGIDTQLPSFAVSITTRDSAERTAALLRNLDPPVISRIQNNRVLLDLRSILPEEVPLLRQTLIEWAASLQGGEMTE